jgi:aminotransferase
VGKKMAKQQRISSNIIQSEIRNMSIECAKVGGINLSQGFSDTDIQPVIGQAAKNAIDKGHNHYTRYDGIPKLREAIAYKLAKYNRIEADPEKNIIVTSGSTAALFCALFALCKPKDEIIVFEPYYGYHLNTIFALDLVPKYHRLNPPDWKINVSRLEELVTQRTRAIIVNTPTNPSGKVYSDLELREICHFAKRNNIIVITDEIYEYFLYDGARHVSPASLKGFADNVITISGYSKTFSITGWRIGYIVSPKRLTQVIGFVHDLMYVCAPAPLQEGVVAGVKHLDGSFYGNLQNSYTKKRDLMCGALDKAGLSPIIPRGAYYILANISKIKGATSKQKVMTLLLKTGIAAVPGEAFYHDQAGKNIARFCFAKKDKVLEKAATILEGTRF